MTTAKCEICGAPCEWANSRSWINACADNPECRAPLGPVQRRYAALTPAMLDALEDDADIAALHASSADVRGDVLHSLIATARIAVGGD